MRSTLFSKYTPTIGPTRRNDVGTLFQRKNIRNGFAEKNVVISGKWSVMSSKKKPLVFNSPGK
jgi:hypothetical protein